MPHSRLRFRRRNLSLLQTTLPGRCAIRFSMPARGVRPRTIDLQVSEEIYHDLAAH